MAMIDTTPCPGESGFTRFASDKVTPVYGNATAGSEAGSGGNQVEDGPSHF